MKYKLFFIILLLSACSTNKVDKGSIELYKSAGFALIYNEVDYENKLINGKLDSSQLEIAHKKIKKNSIVEITNPENKKTIILKVSKKIDYPSFFNVLISKKVANFLNLNPDLPFVEVQEKIKNKSFVAQKAVTYSEEQKVSNTAPVTKVKIKNISNQKNSKIKRDKKFSIIIADFYLEESAINLKDELEKGHVDEGILIVKKLNRNKFRLSTVSYTSINTLKNLYFTLNKYGFDDLDIQLK
tara:strand:+ start:95 stop:820 length:726 start_codon:yes stop_codon:yes gene_type:complete